MTDRPYAHEADEERTERLQAEPPERPDPDEYMECWCGYTYADCQCPEYDDNETRP